MRWYFGLNEAGTRGTTAVHAKLAVLTARQVGGLEPVLLYAGTPNAFTAWMRAHDVEVVVTEPRFAPQIRAAAAAGTYRLELMGHWLRTTIPLTETRDPFVVYTDCDVVFLSRPELDAIRPALFACAPEFRVDNWNYINTGVMVMNIANLRAEQDGFEEYVVRTIGGPSARNYHDQHAYNIHFRRRWDRLDPKLNWKPYWGFDPAAPIVHFHGPKVGAIRSIVDGAWPWDNNTQREISSLFLGHIAAYRATLDRLVDVLSDTDGPEVEMLAALGRDVAVYQHAAPERAINLEFMQFNFFGEP